jgi:hypothetical protein
MSDSRPRDLPYDALEWDHEVYRDWSDTDARTVDDE